MNAVFSFIASCFKIERAWVTIFRLLIESSQFLLLGDGVIRRGADFNVIITLVTRNYASKEYVASVVLLAFLSALWCRMLMGGTGSGKNWFMFWWAGSCSVKL